jgi:3-phosphoglycerate kinase
MFSMEIVLKASISHECSVMIDLQYLLMYYSLDVFGACHRESATECVLTVNFPTSANFLLQLTVTAGF